MRLEGEFLQISADLEDYNSVFYHLWKVGQPIKSDKIATAAIVFDNEGSSFEFQYNPEFWEQLNYNEKLFIVCHETLHIILNHKIRTKILQQKDIANIAADIEVNDYILTYFDFDEEDLNILDDAATFDNVFKGHEDTVLRGETLEYYYNLLKNDSKNEYNSDPEGYTAEEIPGTSSESLKKAITRGLSSKDQEKVLAELEELKAGDGSNIQKAKSKKERVTPKYSWTNFFEKNFKKHQPKPVEQWAIQNRRISCLSSDLFIPSSFEQEEREVSIIKAFLFVDISGSCEHLWSYFKKAILSIPKDKFVISAFVFDTRVKEIDVDKLDTYDFYGGGTAFHPIEQTIRLHTGNDEYPQVVMVFTDGYGTPVCPLKPENWYWIHSGTSIYRSFIHVDSKVISLNEIS